MCKKCGKPVSVTEIFRTTTCPDCGADLHSCVNCKYYAPGSHYDCHETVEEAVSDKKRSNFCDSFSVNRNSAGVSAGADKADAARNAFASLFGN